MAEELSSAGKSLIHFFYGQPHSRQRNLFTAGCFLRRIVYNDWKIALYLVAVYKSVYK